MNHKEIVHGNGKQLAYVRTNDWKDDIILFFHGFCGSKEYFPDIDSAACIVSFDRPGIGESEVEQYYSMEGFLTNVYEVLKEHHVNSVRMIGHSAGGYYAQLFAQMYPDVVKSLSLVSSMVPLNCPATKGIVKGQWKFIVLLSLRFKWFSRFYFKKMASGINKGYEKQLASNMKRLLPVERQFMEGNHDMIKTAVLNAVANDGAGVCYDAYALCQKRDDLTISQNIPVYVWHGSEDTTTPLSFVEFFRSRYSVKAEHIIDHVGHMLYLPCWREIIEDVIR
jgi:pimeloyl-ACP methyl ester carboxylesterase